MAVRWTVMLGLLWLVGCERKLVPIDDQGVVCEGDHWASSAEMTDEIGDCTTITGDLTMTGNALFAIELPALARVDGTLSASLNPALTHIAMPALAHVGGSIRVNNNDVLNNLELPALANVNVNGVDDFFDLTIRDNPLLPSCQAEAIRERLIDHGFEGSSEIIRNGDSCPP